MVAIGIAAQTFGTSGEVGGLVASTSVVGAPGGLVIAGAGAATVAVGDATALFGSYMMSNVSQNERMAIFVERMPVLREKPDEKL